MTNPDRIDPALLDRAAGALVATAVGDALGAGYEFGSAPLVGAAEMIGGGLGGFAPGEFTDDTAMAVAIAEVAATGADLGQAEAQAAIGDRFADWARSRPPDIGISTGAVLAGGTVAGADLPAAARRSFEQTGRAAGNGALMRTAPVALAHLGDDDAMARAARQIAELTHADPLAGDSCVLWCVAIDRAVRFQRLDGPRAGIGLLASDRQEQWAGWIDDAEAAAGRGDLGRFRPNGYTVTALQAAWGAIRATPADGPDHLAAALQAAIAIGDDTDTVAAIAGGLLGAHWGAAAVPPDWLALVHGPEPGRPGTRLDAGHLRRLAIDTASAAMARA